MTWQELKQSINAMSAEELAQPVRFVLFDRDEDIVMEASISYAKKEITTSCITKEWGGAFVIREAEPYLS